MKIPDETIIAALLSCSTNTEAARKCRITEKQLYNRMSTPEFKTKLSEARRGLLNHAVTALETRLSEAAETMGGIMTDKTASPQVRLNAADLVIRNSLRLTERMDVIERLTELEKAVAEMEGNA